MQTERYEVIVLGGGKGGKTLAVELGHKGVKTAMLERSAEMVGGTCINVACIPTKTLVASAHAAHAARRADEFGIRTGEVTVDWPAVRRRAEGVVAAMRAANLKNFTTAPSLDFILGNGRFLEPHVVEVKGLDGSLRQLSAEKIFINTGTRPARPPIPGLEEAGALSSETVQHLDTLPAHLIVLGGGYVALEFAQMFRRLGSEVTVLVRGPQLLKKEDTDVVEGLANVLREEGISIRLSSAIERVEKDGSGINVVMSEGGKPMRISGSHFLVATGRIPNTEKLNLDSAGVSIDAHGFVKVNDRLETTASGIWALGDVNGGPQFTHASLDDYRIVKANVFNGGKRSTSDRLLPSALFTDPELARVGLTEDEARKQGFEVRIAKMAAAAIPRAKTMGEPRGFIKVVIDAKTSKILGCAILAAGAGEILGTVQMAMLAGLPYTALRDAVLAHPTMVEAFSYAFAGL